jgi:xylan 1,4-beta-xylosidase
MPNSYVVRSIPAVVVALAVVSFAAAGAAAQSGATYTNPVIAGDHPDPSVIRVGRDYWATSTSGEWAPLFPLFRSRDLVNWRRTGAVFEERPSWTVRNFWAPEIVTDRGRYFVYYTARKKDGPLCVAVASASRPAGPYTDHGPLVCQEAGSIDACLARDEKDEPYLIWKEDGNSRDLPTPIWAQKLSHDRTRLVGEKTELFRNDAPWERHVVEGSFVVRRDGWFYMFYSGNACCGRECNYALGVARARKLLGPWEKSPSNPILPANDTWKCPGHGSLVTDPRGRDFLLYHAYGTSSDFAAVGRQALLDEVTWGVDGWPTINGGRGPSGRAPAPLGVAERGTRAFFDDFRTARLAPGWLWPQASKPSIRIRAARGGRLLLAPAVDVADNTSGAVLARSPAGGDYTATTLVDTLGMAPTTSAGLSAYSGGGNAVGASVGGGKISVWERRDGKQRILTTTQAPDAPAIHIRMVAAGGERYRFAFSANGRDWIDAGGETDARHLQSVRVALVAGGAKNVPARFEWMRIEPAR